MSKLSHGVLIFLLTIFGCSYGSSAPGKDFLDLSLKFRMPGEDISKLVTNRARDVGVSFSLEPAKENADISVLEGVPVRSSLWVKNRATVIDRLVETLERIENLKGPIVIHQIEVKSIEKKQEEFRSLAVSWSPK